MRFAIHAALFLMLLPGCAQPAPCGPAVAFQDDLLLAQTVASAWGLVPVPHEGPGPWSAGDMTLQAVPQESGWSLVVERNGAGGAPILPIGQDGAQATLRGIVAALAVPSSSVTLDVVQEGDGVLDARLVQDGHEVGALLVGPGVYVQRVELKPMSTCLQPA